MSASAEIVHSFESLRERESEREREREGEREREDKKKKKRLQCCSFQWNVRKRITLRVQSRTFVALPNTVVRCVVTNSRITGPSDKQARELVVSKGVTKEPPTYSAARSHVFVTTLVDALSSLSPYILRSRNAQCK